MCIDSCAVAQCACGIISRVSNTDEFMFFASNTLVFRPQFFERWASYLQRQTVPMAEPTPLVLKEFKKTIIKEE